MPGESSHTLDSIPVETSQKLTRRRARAEQSLPDFGADLARGEHDPDDRAVFPEPARRALDAQFGRHRHVGVS